MKITFLGATGTVTGSKYLINADHKNILVDCGLFQGYKELRLRNWHSLPFKANQIDAVILTHAHIDHSGYLPLLVKQGFRGPIYATKATCDLCAILLPDSGYLQEEEAYYANLKGYSKHKPALPLYTCKDGEDAIKYFQPVELAKSYKLDNEFIFDLHYGGHILGASLVRLKHRDISILFSGDLGRSNDPIMRPPVTIQNTDYLVIESTYGNRLHDQLDPADKIAKIINQTVQRGGSILIPAFAVGRAQTLLYYLYQLIKTEKIAKIPIFLDSPMAIDATKLFYLHTKEHKLTKELAAEVCKVANYIHSVDDSIALDNYQFPIIIISASGMATGGRVLHHLKKFAPDKRNTILFTGFQAGGTRGDRILRGEKEIKMHGKMIPVNAQIETIDNLSAHADYAEILAWLEGFTCPPRKTFITHGEQEAASSLKQKIENQFGWKCCLPQYLQTEELL